jgi:hypothetical protein
MDFLHCQSVLDIAELQRDLYQDAVNDAVEITTSALRIMKKASEDAIGAAAAESLTPDPPETNCRPV